MNPDGALSNRARYLDYFRESVDVSLVPLSQEVEGRGHSSQEAVRTDQVTVKQQTLGNRAC